MKKTKYFLVVAMASIMMSLVDRPALALFESYGSLVPSAEVTQSFEGYRIYPDLDYYFSGSDVWPDAIIGVNKAYTLDSTLWRKIVGTPDVIIHLIASMRSGPSGFPLHGYTILDNKGKPIGVWYSYFGLRSYIKMEGEKTVDIGTPIDPIRPELSAP